MCIRDRISSAQVSLTEFSPGDDILSVDDVDGAGVIDVDFDDTTGVLSLTGDATAAEYEVVLGNVLYQNTSDVPTDGIRDFEIEITTAGDETFSATRPLQVVATNDAPAVEAAVELLDFPVGSLPLVIDDQLVVSDVDSETLSSAVVSIVSGFDVDNDTLDFVSVLGIVGTFDPTTGGLTLAGEASAEDYQEVLQSVTFSTDSDEIDSSRTIQFLVDDGTDSGSDEIEINLV